MLINGVGQKEEAQNFFSNSVPGRESAICSLALFTSFFADLYAAQALYHQPPYLVNHQAPFLINLIFVSG